MFTGESLHRKPCQVGAAGACHGGGGAAEAVAEAFEGRAAELQSFAKRLVLQTLWVYFLNVFFFSLCLSLCFCGFSFFFEGRAERRERAELLFLGFTFGPGDFWSFWA